MGPGRGSWSPSAACRCPTCADPSRSTRRLAESVDLAGFGAVLFTGGFRPDFSWVRVPGGVRRDGVPRAGRTGRARRAPGLYFVGVHFLRKRKSSIFYGVGEDAAMVGGADRRGR